MVYCIFQPHDWNHNYFCKLLFAYDYGFNVYNIEQCFQHSINKLIDILKHQAVSCYHLKRVGSVILKCDITISHRVVSIYDNIVLLSYNRLKASDNFRILDD